MPVLVILMKTLFQSTPPAWGATESPALSARTRVISIHAPRMGSDLTSLRRRSSRSNFNPRPPHGERQMQVKVAEANIKFQSTPPAWGATSRRSLGRSFLYDFNPRPRMGSDLASSTSAKHGFTISIHAPRMGSDQEYDRREGYPEYFNPRPPHGERLRRLRCDLINFNFNPRPPHGERLL